MPSGQNSYGFSFQDAETKNMCLPNVMQRQSYCYNIEAHEMKQHCLAQVK